MDQLNLVVLNSVLQAIASVIAIIGGIVGTIFTLRKLAPGWHTHVLRWLVVLSPLLLSVAGVAVFYFWHQALLASALFALWFFIQIAMFVRDPRPLNREAVMWFGIFCCTFVFSVTMILIADLVSRILSVLETDAELIGKLADTVRALAR
jgi:hypothetical protein